MKKLIASVLLMVGMTTLAQEGKPLKVHAQKEKTSEEREQSQLKRLTSELKLDAGQQKEMANILNERSRKKDAMMAERKANREKGIKPSEEDKNKRRAEMDAFHAEQDAKVRKILKEDQLAQWEKMKEQEKERRKDRMQKRGENRSKAE